VVTKKYSIDSSTKNKGGVITGVTKGQQEQALDTAAFGAKINKIVGPVHGQFGYYVVEVTKIVPSTQQSLAQATPLIKQILNGNRQTAAQTAVDAQAKKAWQSKTKCRSDYSMADCSGYKAPKTTSTVAPSTSTAAPTTTSSSP
jgi:foldase protein PrsA